MVTEREIDVAITLEGVPSVVGVFVLRPGRHDDDDVWEHEVFVELPSTPAVVFEAHRRVVDHRRVACGRVLYGDGDVPLRYLAHRVRVSGFDRAQAERRRDLRFDVAPLTDWAPLRDRIDEHFAAGRPDGPIILEIGGFARAVEDPRSSLRARVLVVHEDRRISNGRRRPRGRRRAGRMAGLGSRRQSSISSCPHFAFATCEGCSRTAPPSPPILRSRTASTS